MDVVCFQGWVVFFFKEKAGYGVVRWFVGSESCIRDRTLLDPFGFIIF